MARKRKTSRKSTARKATTKRRRRSYGRNPGKNIVGQLTNGVKNAAFVVVGKAGARAVPTALGLSTSGVTGIAVQAAAGIGIAMVGEKFLPRGAADFVLAGALTGPIESFLKTANIPFVSAALASYPDEPVLLNGRDLSALGAYTDGTGGDSMSEYDYAQMY